MRRLPACSFLSIVCRVLLFGNFFFAVVVAVGQETSALPDAPSATQTQSKPSNLIQQDEQHEPSKNHILWIIPNYRSDENPEEIKPLTPAEKMKVSLDDSFDPSAFLVAGIFAGISMARASVHIFRHWSARVWQILRRSIRRSSNWQHHDRGAISGRPPPGPSLFRERHGWVLEANRIRHEPGIYHSGR